MVLSDHSIKEELARGRIVVDPLDESAIQPSSIDLKLGSDFRVFEYSTHRYIDPLAKGVDYTKHCSIAAGEAFVLHPGEFALGTTFERVVLPDNVVGRLEGKSTLGRLGLMIHSTAGYVDPGWDGFSYARAGQCGQPSHFAVSRHANRADFVYVYVDSG